MKKPFAALLAVLFLTAASASAEWSAYWGEAFGEVHGSIVNRHGIDHYVLENGITAVIAEENDGTIWLKEESDGTSSWYAYNNENGLLIEGSYFYVRWVSRESDRERWEELYAQLDDSHKACVEEDRLWMIDLGVLNPDGHEYSEPKQPVEVLIGIADDWDQEDLKAVFISPGEDEAVSIERNTGVAYPEGTDDFGVLKLQHFSPYAIYDMDTTLAAEPDLPRTGDSSRMGLWIALTALSCTAALMLRKRARN